MGSRSIFLGMFCLAASLAVACGTEDDSATGGGGNSNPGGAGGRSASAGGAGKAGVAGTTSGAGSNEGGAANEGGSGGEGGEGGAPVVGCTQFAPFVHGLIKDSTTSQALPTTVDNIVFCDDPGDPAAFSDLF